MQSCNTWAVPYFFFLLKNTGELHFISLRRKLDKNPQYNNTNTHIQTHAHTQNHTNIPGDDQYSHDLNTHDLGPGCTQTVGYQNDHSKYLQMSIVFPKPHNFL
jgi:hypothetical protein